MYALIIYKTFVRNISNSKKSLARYDKNMDLSSCKVSLFLSDFNET